MKLEEEKAKLHEERDMWLEDSRKEASNVKYYKRKLEEVERADSWTANHIRELNEEINRLKNRPLWQWIWNDIKPRRKYDYNYYTKEHRRKEFFGKVFRVSLAVAYAVGVFWLWWKLNL